MGHLAIKTMTRSLDFHKMENILQTIQNQKYSSDYSKSTMSPQPKKDNKQAHEY